MIVFDQKELDEIWAEFRKGPDFYALTDEQFSLVSHIPKLLFALESAYFKISRLEAEKKEIITNNNDIAKQKNKNSFSPV